MYSRLIKKDLLNRSIIIANRSVIKLNSSNISSTRFNSIENKNTFLVKNRPLFNSKGRSSGWFFRNQLLKEPLDNSFSNLNQHKRNLSTSINLFNQENKNDANCQSSDDKEIIDLSIGNDFFNSANQTVENVTNLNEVLSASDIGLNPYLLPRVLYDILLLIHDKFQFSWVATIVTTCLIVRLFAFPLYVKSKIQSVQFSESVVGMTKDITDFEKRFKNANSEQELLAKQKESIKMLENFNKSVFRSFTSPLLQACIFSSFFFCLKSMAYHPIPSLKAESFLWIPSLTESDPYFLLPLFTSTTLFLMLKFNMENTVSPKMAFMKKLTYILPIGVFFFTCRFPADLTIYWFINNNITVLFYYLTKQPKLQQYLGIPDIKNEPVDGSQIQDFMSGFQSRMKTISKIHDIEEQNQLNKKAKKIQLTDEAARILQKTEELKKMLKDYEQKTKKSGN